jgi:polysaccharide biosynthesis transport protein
MGRNVPAHAPAAPASHPGGFLVDLAGYLTAVRRWWFMLIVAAVVAGVAGYAVASRLTPSYASTARLLVGPVNSDSNTLRGASQLVQTYSQLVQTSVVLDPAITALGLNTTRVTLQSAVNVSANDVTRLVDVKVTWADPDIAAKIANELAKQLIAVAASTPARPESELSVVDPAIPAPPAAPNPLLVALLAAMAGFVLAVVAAYAVEAFNPTVRTPEDARATTRLAVLGSVAGLSRLRRSAGQLVVQARPSSRDAVAYRLLAARVETADPGHPVRTVLVAGVGAESISSDVAANLAAVYAAEGHRVVLVDADEHGAVSRLFELEAAGGQRRVAGRADTAGVLAPVSAGFDVLSLGLDRGGTVTVERAQSILGGLLARTEIVVVDGATADRSAGVVAWGRAADVSLLVVRPHRTRRAVLASAVESLQLSGAKVAGIVVHRGGTLPAGRGAAATKPGDTPFFTTPAPTEDDAVAPPDAEHGTAVESPQAGIRYGRLPRADAEPERP